MGEIVVLVSATTGSGTPSYSTWPFLILAVVVALTAAASP